MMRYSVQPRDRIFAKGYGFLSFAKNMGKNIGKYINKNLSSKYSKNFLDHAKQSATDALKTTSKRAIQEVTGDLNDNKISNRITKVSSKSQQINSGTITNENDKEIPKERYIFPAERQKILMI